MADLAVPAPRSPAAAAAASTRGTAAPAPATKLTAPAWALMPPPEATLAIMLDSSCGGPPASRALNAVRLVYGVGLAAFTAWAFSAYSGPDSWKDGLPGSFGRTAAQLTNWGVVLTAIFFTMCGATYFRAPRPPLPHGAAWTVHDRRLRLLLAALWPTAFALEVVITVLFWSGASTAGSSADFRLGSAIVKHIQMAPLLVNLVVGRFPCAASNVWWPLVVALGYIAVAAIYALAVRGQGPYTWLTFTNGLTAATIFIGLALLLVGFAFLWWATRLRERLVTGAAERERTREQQRQEQERAAR